MKRYIIGILAVMIGAAAAGFTEHKTTGPTATFTFRYTQLSYTQALVQTNSNWVAGSSACASAANKACQMEVTDTYTHLDANNNRVLNTTGNVIVIKAVKGASGTDFVPNPPTSTGIPSKVDKP